MKVHELKYVVKQEIEAQKKKGGDEEAACGKGYAVNYVVKYEYVVK